MTTKEDIRDWLIDGRRRKDITHMLVVCDTWDYGDYPIYVRSDENPMEIYKNYNGKNMQKVMEVYSYGLDLTEQLNQHRAFNF